MPIISLMTKLDGRKEKKKHCREQLVSGSILADVLDKREYKQARQCNLLRYMNVPINIQYCEFKH